MSKEMQKACCIILSKIANTKEMSKKWKLRIKLLSEKLIFVSLGIQYGDLLASSTFTSQAQRG